MHADHPDDGRSLGARVARRARAAVRLLAGPLVVAGVGAGTASAQPPDATPRFWQASDGSAVFAVATCADTGTAASRAGGGRPSLCGRVVWAKEGLDRADHRNRDASLRTRRLCNALVLQGFSRASATRWTDGTVYDWDGGRSYKTDFVFTSDSTAELQVRFGVIRQKERLTRVGVPPSPCRR